jgi:plasmid stabilization system protein ParE
VKLRLFPAAIRDLKELRAHIAVDDPSAAASVAAHLDKAIALIAEKPTSVAPRRNTRRGNGPYRASRA